MKRISILFSFFLMISFQLIQAQSDYALLKEKLNDKSLPLINLTVNIDSVNSLNYIPAVLTLADVQKRTNSEKTEVTYACRVKYRGSSSLAYDKKSFALKIVDDEGYELNVPLMGIRPDDSWVLSAMAVDRIRMRDRVNFDAWNAMSAVPYETSYQQRNGTVGYFVEVFINGSYHGLYCLSDKINRKLLGLEKSAVDNDGEVDVKGLIYKCISGGVGSMLEDYEEQDMTQPAWNCWELKYPDKSPCEATFSPLKELIDFCASITDAQFEDGFNRHFYMGNIVDYAVFYLAQGLRDNQLKNVYLSFRNVMQTSCALITPWDLDTSLGGDWEGSHNELVADSWMLENVNPFRRLWTGNMFDFRARVAQRWRELSAGPLSVSVFNARVDSCARLLTESGAWEREYNKWNGNPVCLTRNLEEETAYVKNWYQRNSDNLRQRIFSDFSTSGIEHRPESQEKSEISYDLQGRSVGNSYRGIIIQKKKKIWRK